MEFRGIRDSGQATDGSSLHGSGVPVFRNQLRLKLVGGLLALVTVILITSCYVIWFSGRPFLLTLAKQSQEEMGRNVMLALSEHLGEIQGISRAMSKVAAHTPHDETLYKKVFPELLNSLGEHSMIVGGGVWPEPYRFDDKKIRSSYFWGRNEDGYLQFYNEYNKERGRGYHSEEWYAPAAYLTENALYWSKSYTDPHLLKPMVTCSSPIIRDGVFIGVTTVDLLLESVSRILDELVGTINAYAFVVDRNDKFIAYPFPKDVVVERKVGGKSIPDYLHIDELVKNEPGFMPVIEQLHAIRNHISTAYSSSSPYYHDLVENISRKSDQISLQEAKIIAANIWSSKTKTSSLSSDTTRFELAYDPIFGEPSSVIIYTMPGTNWKLVVAFKQSAYAEEPSKMVQQLLFFTVLSIVLFGLIAYLILNYSVMRPIKDMTGKIARSVSQEQDGNTRVDINCWDELGQLAYWFNLRSEQLERARDIADIANQAKTNFIAKMSHELRTPLNSVIGFSKRLQDSLRNSIDDRSYSAINKIYENGKELLAVIDDILNISSLEKGDQSMKLDVHRVNAMLEVVKKNAEKLNRSNNVKLAIHMMEVEEYLYCDREKFIQVLMNLISNALRCTDFGSVTVVARRVVEMQKPMIRVDVIDTGVGIQEADLKKLFIKFSQISSRVGIDPGTGLGLYLSKRIVELHKGKIEVRSQYGEGSTFIVYFPLERGGDSH